MSERVHFFGGEVELTGWALNVSRGGLRAIVEDPIELGAEFEITIGDSDVRRPGRIVWVQDEPDGSIVGISYLDDIGAPPGPDGVAATSPPPRQDDV